MICGFQDLSLIDYPGHIAPVVFIGGCNFRCPFCQNKDLVINPGASGTIEPGQALQRIKGGLPLADGVVISGGEPTLWLGLEDFISGIKDEGFKVKIDTNGSHPEVIKSLVDKGLIDFIAMDIKASPSLYSKAAGVDVNLKIITSSIDLIKTARIGYEFRTTCVPGLISAADMPVIARMLGEGQPYTLQPYIPDRALDLQYQGITPFNSQKMKALLSAAISSGLKARLLS
jgi:pyruvate formate lyase activating enzyme